MPEIRHGSTRALPWRDQVVRNGDNLSLIFKRAGFGTRDVYRRRQPVGARQVDWQRIYPGQIHRLPRQRRMAELAVGQARQVPAGNGHL